MNIQKLKQRLQREAKKNPKQAVALGILLLAAIWFWTPLVWSWLPTGGGAGSPASLDAPLAAVSASGPLGDELAKEVSKPTAATEWQMLVEWMEHDPLMVPAVQLVSERNPFSSPEAPPSEAEELEYTPLVLAEELTPEQAGLVLTSTIVGPKRRAALISGRAYAEGRKIVQLIGQQQVIFKLTEVHPNYIVLERDQSRYELKLAESNSAPAAIQFAPASAP